jgi:hypothetical protein
VCLWIHQFYYKRVSFSRSRGGHVPSYYISDNITTVRAISVNVRNGKP